MAVAAMALGATAGAARAVVEKGGGGTDVARIKLAPSECHRDMVAWTSY